MDFEERTLIVELEWIDELSNEPTQPPAMELAMFLLGMQSAYESICEALELSPHHLEVDKVSHPNASISFKGIGEPIKALKDLLEAIPKLVVAIWTIPDQIRERREEIRANTEYQKLIQKAAAEYEKIPPQHRLAYFKRIFSYFLSDRVPERLPKTRIRKTMVQ
jgi:hypothetical protein